MKVWKLLIYICFIAIIIVICIIMRDRIIETIKNVRIEKEISENQKEILANIDKENDYYNLVINFKYQEQKYNEPYIPEGYRYIEGEWNTGFVIQDKNGNEYVWIPTTNEEIENVVKLQKKNFSNNAWISKDLCYDTEYENFLDSALKYGGFYIARYEIGKEDESLPVSKKNIEVWTNINKDEANNIIRNMNDDNTDVIIQLMNSYAYDTAFQWIYSSNKDIINYEIINDDKMGKRYTGTKSFKNIYDLYDTTYEMTTEVYYENRTVCRGPAGTYDEVMNRGIHTVDNRTSLYWDEMNVLGFRTILYKEK